MEVTKNDLSSGLAKLDLVALLQVVKIAYYSRLNAIADEVKRLQGLYWDNEINSGCKRNIIANNIKNLSQLLPTCTETLHTLEEAKTREEIQLINEEIFRQS